MLRKLKAWLRRGRRVSLQRETPRPTPGQRDASQALHRAECARDLAMERAPQVTEAAARLREARTRNHFAEMFQHALEGR